MAKGLLRGSAMNFAGMIFGTLVSFVGYPMLVRGLGAERFGVSSIAGAVVGYFLIFDLGLGRASIVVLGQALEERDERKISGLFWSGQVAMLVLGIVGALVLAATAPILCHSILRVPPYLVRESVWGLCLIAGSIPVMILFSAHLGLLGNLGRFKELNLIRSVMNVLSWVGPVVALRFRHDLIATLGAMLFARIVTLVLSMATCLWLEPSIRRIRFATWRELLPMAKQGGWMSITNLVSPLMSYMDRTMVGAWASLSMVTYYSIAGDTTQKLWILQASIGGALFPLLPGLLASDRPKAMVSCRSAFHLIHHSLVPIVLVTSAFGRPFLDRWIGPTVAPEVYLPFSILLLGIFINSFAYVPFCLIMADGRSKYAALLHLLEFPVFFGLLFLLVRPYGAAGAAIAWTLRVTIDTAGMFIGGWEPFRNSPNTRKDILWVGLVFVALLASCFPLPFSVRCSMDLGCLALWAVAYRDPLRSRIERGWERALLVVGRSTSRSQANF